jgi:hypothetical protein
MEVACRDESVSKTRILPLRDSMRDCKRLEALPCSEAASERTNGYTRITGHPVFTL